MWRKAVCARSKDDPNWFMLALGNRGNNSVLLGFVDSVIGRNGRRKELVNQYYKILIGDGHDTYF